LTFDAEDRLFVGDVLGQSIYEVRPESGAAAALVGAPLGEADDLEFGPDGTLAWTAFFAGEVRARRPDGEILTLASGHPGFNSLAFAPDGRLFATTVFLGDALYEIDLEGKKPARLVGEGFGGLNGFDFGPDGFLYGPLFTKGKIARVDVETGEVEVVAKGFGVPAAVNFNSKGELFAVDAARGEVVRVDPASGATQVVAQVEAMVDNLAFDSNDRLFITNASDNAIIEIDVATGAQDVKISGLLSVPGDVSWDATRKQLLVPDVFSFRAVRPPDYDVLEIARAFERELHLPIFAAASERWFAVSGLSIGGLSPGAVQVFEAATGADQAVFDEFEVPHGLLFEDTNHLLVADFEAGTLSRIDVTDATSRDVVVQGLRGPLGVARDAAGAIYVSEYRAGAVTKIDLASGTRSVIVEGLDSPEGLDVFPDGRIAIAEVGKRRIISIDPESGRLSVLAAQLPIGLDLPDALPAAGLPTGVAAVDDDTLYFVSDQETALYRLSRPEPD
jgi:sugar lactone lactonase YvrE